MKHNLAVMVIGDQDDAGRLPVTQANLDGRVWTTYANDPMFAETPEALLPMLAAKAPEHGTVLVHNELTNIGRWWDRMLEFGWASTSQEGSTKSGWGKFWDPANPAHPVYVCARMTAAENPLFGRHTPDQDVAWQLTRWHAKMGTPWFSTGSMTGATMLRDLWAGTTAVQWNVKVPDEIPAVTFLYDWKAESATGHLWDTWDGRRFQLNACAQVSVPLGRLKRGPARPYDRRERGYWRINAYAARGQIAARFGCPKEFPMGLLIPDDTVREDGTAWVRSPVCDLLSEWRIEPDVHETYLSATSFTGLPMRPWAFKIRDALAPFGDDREDPFVVAAKQVYSNAPAAMASDKGRITRRDWYDDVLAHQNASIARRIGNVYAKTGFLPAGVHADAITYRTDYIDDFLDIDAAIGVGDFIGQMKRKRGEDS